MCPQMERTWPGAPAGLMTHLTTVLRRMHDSTRGGPYNPMPIVKRIRLLGKQFRPGRQEDSHEFLRCLLDAVLLHELRVRFRALWPCQGLCSSADEPADAPRPVFGLPVQSLDAPAFLNLRPHPVRRLPAWRRRRRSGAARRA